MWSCPLLPRAFRLLHISVPLWLALVCSFFHTRCLLVFVNISLLLRGRIVTFLVLSVLDSRRMIMMTVMAPASLLKRTSIIWWLYYFNIYNVQTMLPPLSKSWAEPCLVPPRFWVHHRSRKNTIQCSSCDPQQIRRLRIDHMTIV